MKTAIYLRVSTARQMLNNGTRSQEDAIRDYLARNAIDPDTCLWFREPEGVSGTSKVGRKALDGLIAGVNKGAISTVIAYSFSRLFRSFVDAAGYIQLSIDRGVRTICVSDGFTIDPGSPFSKAVAQIAAAFAELQGQINRDNASAGIQAKLARGERHGPKTIKPGVKGFRWLNDEQVAAIQAEDRAQTYGSVAKKHGVDPKTVWRLWKYKDGVMPKRPRGKRPTVKTA